jgi:methionyl-tRNA synthetase
MGLNLIHLFGHLAWPVIPASAKKIHETVMEAPDIIPFPDEPMKEFLSQLEAGQP